MRLLKSHGGAVAVTAVVILLSILLGSHRSLSAERDAVEAAFFPTEERSFSISTDLGECMSIAANLQSVGTRYLEEGALTELEESHAALANWRQGVGTAHDAYQRLLAAAEQVIAQLEASGLSQKDVDYLRGFRADLAARVDMIARNDYNKRVDAFNDEVLGGFPANILGRITFVRQAEAFR